MKKQWKWAIGIVVFCLLSPMALFVVHIVVRANAVDGGAATVSQFLAALKSHDYAAAHALLAPPQQAALSVAAMQKTHEESERKRGYWISAAMPNEYHLNDALDHIAYFYTVNLDKNDEMYVMVWVAQTHDGWRVIEYHYDYSPA